MTYYITHIIPEKLPENNFKQISFLSATKVSYAEGILYFGYNGARPLTEIELSEEISEGKIVRLSKAIIVEGEKYLWIDPEGKLWTSDDNLLKQGKTQVGTSSLKPNSKSEIIFKEKVQPKLDRIQKRTRLTIKY